MLRHKQVSQFTREGLSMVAEVTVNVKEVELNKTPDNSLFEFVPPPKAKQVQALNLPGERVNLTGKAAIDFALKDTQGQKIRLSGFRGQIVLIDFWATWCPPCRKELPCLQKLSREYQDKGVVILTVSDEESGTVKGFLKKNEFALQTLLDSNREVHKMYGVRAIPTVVVVDRQGAVAAHYVGSRSEEELMAALKLAGL